MSTKENCKKANIIRTKLLLLIANEQSEKKKTIDKNVMRLNRKSVEEINEKYHINSFEITMSNTIINGGKNLCMSFASNDYSKSIIKTPNKKDEGKLLKKNLIARNKLGSFLLKTEDLPIEKEFNRIIINAKRKISHNKLHIESFSPEKKVKKELNLEKLKLIEIQKNNISILRNIAGLLKDYNLCKKQSMKRQKSVSIQITNKDMKNEEVRKGRNTIFYSSKGIPIIKNDKFLGKNNNKPHKVEKKKSHNSCSKIINDILIEDKNYNLLVTKNKSKNIYKGDDNNYYINNPNKDIRPRFSIY
jgi:hypothetical protein